MRDVVRALVAALLVAAAGCGETAAPEVEVPMGTAEGHRPPALEGVLATGEPFAGLDALGGPDVLIFYRSAGCGLCRVQLEQIQRNLSGYRSLGVNVVGITLDPPEVSRTLVEELGLEFPLLSVDSAAFREWDVLDLEQEVPMPATYIVDEAGIIRFRHIGRNAADRTTDAGVMTILERLTHE